MDSLVRLAITYHLLGDTRVAVLKDLGEIKVGESWENIRRGEEVTLPTWFALIMEGRGAVEIREQRIEDVDISKYLLIERGLKGAEFQRLRNTFYIEAKNLLLRLKEAVKKEGGEGAFIKLARVEADFKDLVRTRLRKIVQIALLSRSPEDYAPMMLLEERILLTELSQIIRKWFEEVTRDD